MRKISFILAIAALGSACNTEVTPEGEESVAGLGFEVSSSCFSGFGVRPTQASLAVAMATELKRWKAETDLVNVNGRVELSSTGQARCNANGGCPRTKNLLALQDSSTNDVISQHVFSAGNWYGELSAGFSRQKAKLDELRINNPGLLPEDHKLTLVGGPISLGTGACGPHYMFKATKPDGSPLKKPDNLRYTLSFFGYDQGNPFLSFVSNGDQVGVDPIDGDNSAPVTTSGSCPTYELNRLYDPGHAKLHTCCVSIDGQNGALQALLRAPGYLGCRVGAIPAR